MSASNVWLSQYASNVQEWRRVQENGRPVHFRQLGIVEMAFDIDGVYFEGRADMNSNLYFDLRTRLDEPALRRRLLLAWAIFRQEHPMLSCKVKDGRELPNVADTDQKARHFVFEPCQTYEEMLQEAADTATFVADHYSGTGLQDFYVHLMNTARSIDPTRSLSRLFIMPSTMDDDGLLHMHLILVVGHQISDGLTWFRWHSSFLDLLNKSGKELKRMGNYLTGSNAVHRLPPAQEMLYPPINGSTARRRWFWIISRILRHVRKPPPASFPDPLHRTEILKHAMSMPPTFTKVLDYSKVPPLNSFTVSGKLSPQATRRLSQICRQVNISIGSGCFALIAMVMMELEERFHPSIPLSKRLPFVGSFPVNPRPFLAGEPTSGKEDSLMLAFSSGISLPFLSSDISAEGRLKLLGRQAHRQLRQYQKRRRSLHEKTEMGTRSPDQLLPQLYMNTLDMVDTKIPEERPPKWDIQGQYPAKMPATKATCGISSVGDRTLLISGGKYDVTHISPGKDLVADFRDMSSAVRVRDGEFLVGVTGEKDTIRFGASYDGCAIDPERAEQWRKRVEDILEPEEDSQNTLSAHL